MPTFGFLWELEWAIVDEINDLVCKPLMWVPITRDWWSSALDKQAHTRYCYTNDNNHNDSKVGMTVDLR